MLPLIPLVGAAAMSAAAAVLAFKNRRNKKKAEREARGGAPDETSEPERSGLQDLLGRHFRPVFGKEAPEGPPDVGAAVQRRLARELGYWTRHKADITTALCVAVAAGLAVAGWLHPPWREANLFTGLQLVANAAAVGIFTNWLALRYFFTRVLEKRKGEVMDRIGDAVQHYLVNRETIRETVKGSPAHGQMTKQYLAGLQNVLEQDAFREDLKIFLREHLSTLADDPEFRHRVDEFRRRTIRNSGNGVLGVVQSWLMDAAVPSTDRLCEMLRKLPDQVGPELVRLDHLLDRAVQYVGDNSEPIDEFVTDQLARALGSLDVKAKVVEQLEKLDRQTDGKALPHIIYEVCNTELFRIQLAGAIIGAVVGLAQWLYML